MTDKLTYKEAVSIIKAIVAYNNGQIDFMNDYLKYADELELHVARGNDMIKVWAVMPRE